MAIEEQLLLSWLASPPSLSQAAAPFGRRYPRTCPLGATDNELLWTCIVMSEAAVGRCASRLPIASLRISFYDEMLSSSNSCRMLRLLDAGAIRGLVPWALLTMSCTGPAM